MRIIAGFAKGINLKVFKAKPLRPTSARVKESLFNTLGSMRGCHILDLFAGSGSLGLEALSRGASKVFFFEKNKKFAKQIEENLFAVLKSGDLTQNKSHKIFPQDYKKALILGERFDFIFVDPPYFKSEKILSYLFRSEEFFSLLAPKGIFIVEHPQLLKLDVKEGYALQTRNFGTTCFSFIRKRD